MKNSGIEWIGEIPDDWEVTQVKNIFNIGRGRVIAQTELDEHGKYPVYSSQTKDNGCLGYINTYDFDINQLTWTTDGANAGTVFLRKGKHNCTNVCGTLQLKQTSNILLFYKYALEYLTIFNKRADTNGFKIMNNEMAKIITLLPPKSTQQRIATYLDKKCSKIEETIQNQQQVIEKLKAYKQSLITEAVTGKVKIVNGKICGEYESYKDSGVEWIGKIPSGWEVIKLKFSSQIMRGLFSHRPRNDPDYYDGVHPFIQTGEVARAVKYITTYSQTLNELGFSVSREFPAGTVLLTIAANVGDVAILDFNACFPDSVIGFYPKENVSKIFMFYVLKSMKEQFMRNAIISTQMNLNINIVKEEFIPLPTLAEQKEIVKFLEKKSDYIDTAIEQKQKLIEKLTEYKKSLIYECVTGKKEI